MNKKIVVLDIETDGLNPSVIWCVVLKQLWNNRVIKYVKDDEQTKGTLPLSSFRAYVANTDTTYVAHNGSSFDFPVLERLLNISILVDKQRDTLVLSRLADPERQGGHSLENWGKFFGLAKQEHEDWTRFSPEMLERCVRDVEITHLVYLQLQKELKDFSPQSIQLEVDAHRLMLAQEKNGFYLDKNLAETLFITTKRRADAIQEIVTNDYPGRYEFVKEVNPRWTAAGVVSKNSIRPIESFIELWGNDDVLGGLYSVAEFREFNLDSPTQRVRRLLELGWQPKNKTEAGNPKFDAKTIIDPNDPPLVKTLVEYLMTRSRQRTVQQWLDLRDDSGYVHGKVLCIGTRTHRMAHRNPNLGNIPRVKREKNGDPLKGFEGKYGWECRSCWTIENTRDNVLIGVDLSGIQLRAFAHYIGNEEYIRRCIQPGFDIHSYHADAFGCSRDSAKTLLYSFLMGAGAYKLGSIVGGNGAAVLKRFYELVPGLKEFKEGTLGDAANSGTMEAIDGSVLSIPTAHLAMSTYLQSFEAKVIKWSLNEFYNRVAKLSYTAIPRVTVHDEHQFEAPVVQAEELKALFGSCVRDAGEHFNSICPLSSDSHSGLRWADTH